jgi:hypothetical protein
VFTPDGKERVVRGNLEIGRTGHLAGLAHRLQFGGSLDRSAMTPQLAAVKNVYESVNGPLVRVWRIDVPATARAQAHVDAGKLLLPAVNAVFDMMTTRTMAARTHPAPVIFVLLFALGFGCALLAGHAMAAAQAWSWMHAVAFAFFITAGTYVILDIEYPRAGFFRLSAYDQVLIDLRDQMK